MEHLLDELLVDAVERTIPDAAERDLSLPLLPNKADVVIGMRRSGKTYFLYRQMRRLLEEGIPRERMLYLDFEDERLIPMKANDLQLIPELYYRRFPHHLRDALCWFVFDEIQNVPGWERFVRRLLDQENVRFLLSGSSARLLSREIATSLRGRSIASELLPFSFAETLRHQGIHVPTHWPVGKQTQALLENRFQTYFESGGFPEVQGLDMFLRRRILQDYVDVVVLRDVAERHGISNITALRYLQRSLLAHPASRFSIHRIHNDLKSQGVRVGKDSLHLYLELFEDAFLLFPIEIHSASLRVRQTRPRKIYPIDHALAAAASLRAAQDVGHLLESIVYLELRRRGAEIAYVLTKEDHEVDFLARFPDGAAELIQVCADAGDPITRNRELRALREARTELDIHRTTLVTLWESGEENGVRLIPAWRWLLDRSIND